MVVLRENGFLDAITLWPTHTDTRYLDVMMMMMMMMGMMMMMMGMMMMVMKVQVSTMM